MPFFKPCKAASVRKLWSDPTDMQNVRLRRCILNYIGGSIIKKWKKKNSCQSCISLLCNFSITNEFLKNKQFVHAVIGLQQPSQCVVTFLESLETLFIHNYTTFFNRTSVMASFLQFSSSAYFPYSPCHPELRKFLCCQYFVIRIHHQCRLLTRALKANPLKAQKKAKRIGFIAHTLKRRCINTFKI
jgi:hypothetical protein